MKNLKEEIQSVVDIFKSGDLLKAEKMAKKLISSNPKMGFMYNLIGLIYSQQEKNELAFDFYNKGIKIDPNFAMLYNNLALLLMKNRTTENIKKAEENYKKCILKNDKIPEPHNNLASLYSSVQKYNEAISSYKKAININSKFAPAYYNISNVYIELGNFEEGKINLEKSIELYPDFHQAHRSLSRIIKYNKDNKHFIQLKKIYEKTNDGEGDKKVNLAFALGKAYEDIKDYKNSFLLYEKANFIYRKKIKFSIDDESKKFSDIKKTFHKKLFKLYGDSGLKGDSPIFILGMPRSGTTLIEQILASHPKVFGAGEVEFIPKLVKKYYGDQYVNIFLNKKEIFKKDELVNIGKEYKSKMSAISKSCERNTDKLPINFLWIGFIKLILPKSKIIHCFRNINDNILSIFKNHFPGDKINFAYNLDEIKKFYNLYENLMDHWKASLPDFIHDIKYENLILNPKLEINKILNFCDLEWNDECLNFHKTNRPIKTASNYQARSKIYKSSINSWKNYKNFLTKK